MSKWERDDVKIEEPPKTVVINKRPWIYLDMSRVNFSLIKSLISLAILVNLAVIGFATYSLIVMLNTPQWPNAGIAFGGLLCGGVCVLFLLFLVYAFTE